LRREEPESAFKARGDTRDEDPGMSFKSFGTAVDERLDGGKVGGAVFIVSEVAACNGIHITACFQGV
jgi:hypothetical protein